MKTKKPVVEVSRQRRWQIKMANELRCIICGESSKEGGSGRCAKHLAQHRKITREFARKKFGWNPKVKGGKGRPIQYAYFFVFSHNERLMTVVSNFDELIKVSHEMAVEKGWWPTDNKRSVTEIFANLHAELSESWEEYRRGRMLPWHEAPGSTPDNRAVYGYEDLDKFPAGPKPEGFGVELADFLIRLADWCGSLGVEKLEERDEEIKPDYKVKPDEIIIFLHETTSNLFMFADSIEAGNKLIDGLLFIFRDDLKGISRELVEKKKCDATCTMVSRAVHVCLNQVESFIGNDNLWKVVNLKQAYNANREKRHGGLLA